MFMLPRRPADAPPEPSQTGEPPEVRGRRFTDTQPSCDSTIAAGLRVRGAVSGAGSIRVEGDFEGRIEIDGLCHIAKGARMVGPIAARDVIVEGELEGRLVVQGRVELLASAIVRAGVEARIVAVAEGCFFEGHVNMPGGDGPIQPVTFREKRRRRPAPQPAPEPVVAAPDTALGPVSTAASDPGETAKPTTTPPTPATQPRSTT